MNILHQHGNDITLGTRSAPRLHVVKTEAMNFPNAIRTYRCSPEDVAVQIRLGNRYVNATLTLEEARFVAEQILIAANA